jgi:hypothetical protein
LFVGIGASLGSLGGGGSILALPVLVYLLDVPPPVAVPMSLVIVGASSLSGTFLRWKAGEVHWRALFSLASTGAAGAFIGSELTRLVEAFVLMAVFAVVLLATGALMLGPASEPLPSTGSHVRRCLVAGVFVGVLTGFLGAGGGFLIVPALVLYAGLDMKQASGTAVGVISVNSAAGILGHLRFAEVDGRLTGLLLSASILGVAVGVAGARHVPTLALRRTLGALMIAVGLWIAGASLLGTGGDRRPATGDRSPR